MSKDEDHQPAAPVATSEDDKIAVTEKTNLPTPTVHDGDLEIQTTEEPEKKYYSKLSVWLMVLFSGLAIGSDG